MTLYAQIIPAHDEYQNFGVMQALDVINVFYYLKYILEMNILFENVIALGSSHGGYIAHMANKFSPNMFKAIIDNSSYVEAPMQYLGDAELSLATQYNFKHGKLNIACGIKTPWVIGGQDKIRTYGYAAQMIRSTILKSHLDESMRKSIRPCHIFSCNASYGDGISPKENKLRQKNLYEKCGYIYELDLVDKQDIDGYVFKEMTHGLKASMYGILERYISKVDFNENKSYQDDFELSTILEFDCGDRKYTVSFAAYEMQPVRLDVNIY